MRMCRKQRVIVFFLLSKLNITNYEAETVYTNNICFCFVVGGTGAIVLTVAGFIHTAVLTLLPARSMVCTLHQILSEL